jgi:NAD(P)-dependent dehydrogenase (short-subunit alcohol dehydrogenase family)
MSTDNQPVYLIVGGSGGIGAEVTRQLVANGGCGGGYRTG